ncbi:hypothetical protein ACPOL_6037 [Acidisarcina polymorpha]|uniref:Uncharacterized protein n=1 Tax=Acidisarcina polymorpha TaxID=2211140 RepID=A0A2Z5G887_9BACT|nr:hypothetical protein ACPOL_6037 [Acidisarcina polymorpha]
MLLQTSLSFQHLRAQIYAIRGVACGEVRISPYAIRTWLSFDGVLFWVGFERPRQVE